MIPITHPALLKSSVRDQPIQIFFCGPGIGTEGYHFRENIRRLIDGLPKVSITYGEEIDTVRLGYPKADLQTTEARFAHSTDLTVLLLQSAGSIAELGTFSMIPNVRPRLFVAVPMQFYDSPSYINRGPLSLIAHSHVQNIGYFEPANAKDVFNNILFPISLAKFARYNAGYDYIQHVIRGQSQRVNKSYLYEEFISPFREKYIQSLVYIAILINENTNFIDIVNTTHFNPQLVRTALRSLFDSRKIEKISPTSYKTNRGYRDGILSYFDTTALSKKRTQLAALA